MKLAFASCAILFFISAANAFLQSDILETLQKVNDEKAASKLAVYTDSQIFDPNEVQAYIDLLKNSGIMKSTEQKIYIRDFAVKALEEITRIKATDNAPVKAILSCVKNDKVYRYHIPELSSKEQQRYKEKIKHWLLEKIPH